MNVGDYVRTKCGIAKIIDISCGEDLWFDNDNIFDEDEKEIFRYNKPSMYSNWVNNNIIKSSPNITDLIEVGDIITFKDDEDVYKVIGIPDKECALEVFYLVKNYDGNTEDIMVYPDEMKNYIKSIVTHEQFSQMEYKVGE